MKALKYGQTENQPECLVQILCVSKPTTTKPDGKSAGMLGTDIISQALNR